MAKMRTGVTAFPEQAARATGAQKGAAAAASPQEYWTPEKMKEAIAIRLPIVPDVVIPEPHAAGVAGADMGSGAAVTGDPLPPDGGNDETLSAGVFQTTRVGSQFNTFPYSAVGKLFMVFPSGTFVGSAWVVGERAIVTAGHCVFDHNNGGAATSLMFEGNFLNEEFSQRWNVVNKAAPNAWVRNMDFRADMAICIVDTPIRSKLGKLGYRANQSPAPAGPFTQIGYPKVFLSPAFPFDGEEMWQTRGELADYPSPVASNMGRIRAGGNMTPGCSGGPWVDPKDQFRAAGLNSARLANDPNNLTSPYLGDRFLELLDWMAKNGGDSIGDDSTGDDS